MNCRIAVITDIHYCVTPPIIAARQGQWGALLLRRTIERLNRYMSSRMSRSSWAI